MNIFKRSSFILLMMMIMLIATGCPSPTSSSEPDTPVNPDNPDVPVKVIPVTGVTLDKSDLLMKAGEIVQLTTTIAPSDATVKTVIWTTSDEEIATVSDSGLVTTKKVGDVTITATTKDGSFKANCSLTVTTPFLVIYQSTTIMASNLGGREGADAKLTEMAPENVSNTHAFLSVNADDEIRDMPGNYGYPEDIPIMALNSNGEVYLIADNWADLLDGTIKISFAMAGFKTEKPVWYSGTSWNGEKAYTQNGWDSSSIVPATVGNLSYFDYTWINSSTHTGDLYFLGIGTADTLFNYNESKSVTITFDKNGAVETAPDSISYILGQYIAMPGPGSMKYEGHALTGWNTAKDGSGTEYGARPMITGPESDVTLYAQWDEAFISTWKTDIKGSTNENTIKLPVRTYYDKSCFVNWGDGKWSEIVTDISRIYHTYEAPGTYVVSIAGHTAGFNFGYDDDSKKIISIDQWGPINLGNDANKFRRAENLVIKANDAPDLTGITNMESAFEYCISLSNFSGIENWDVSEVTNFKNMFKDCDNFNGNVSSWNTQSAQNMQYMFFDNKKFDQDLSNWDFSNVFSLHCFLSMVELSTANYDKLLISLSTSTKENYNFDAGKSTYSSASASARQALIDKNWNIKDGGSE